VHEYRKDQRCHRSHAHEQPPRIHRALLARIWGDASTPERLFRPALDAFCQHGNPGELRHGARGCDVEEQFTVYKGSNLIQQEVVAKTSESSVAYKYDAGLKGLSTADSRLTWRDLANVRQEYLFGGARNEREAPLDRQIISTTEATGFGQRHFEIPFDATGKKWVRFAAWDIAGNGALVQPIKLNVPQTSTK